MEKSLVSIIMPCLNEEKNISGAVSDTLRAIDDFKLNGEIIVVNDGSKDSTRDMVNEIIKNDRRVRLINHNSTLGIGVSFWEGVSQAAGDIVSMFPGDNENDPAEILRYSPLLESVDLVVPFAYNKDIRSRSRVLLSFIYHKIVNNAFGVSMNYTNGTILYRKSVLRQIDSRIPGYFFQTDILVRLIKNGYLFAEVPYRLQKRSSGKSKAISFYSFLQVMVGFFKLFRDIYFTNYKQEIITDSATKKRFSNV